MRAIVWLCLVLIVVVSCDESELERPHKKRISSIKYSSSTFEGYWFHEFQYTGKRLSSVRQVFYQELDPNAEPEITEDILYNYIYSDGVMKQIEVAQSIVTEFLYGNGGLTSFGSSYSGSHFTYDALGKLESETSHFRTSAGSSTTTTEVVWDGDNIERGFITQTADYRGNPSPIVTYDTVSFEYGDQVNIFADTTYLGYTLINIGSLFPFSQNNILKSERATDYYHTYGYTYSEDKYPIKIAVTTVYQNVPTEVYTWEIEYEE